MPRCSSEGRIINTQEVTLTVDDGKGAAEQITLQDPWVFKLLQTEWHPDDNQGNLTDPNTTISLPAMTLVGERLSNGLGTLYVPVTTTAQERVILVKMFGPTRIATYSQVSGISEVLPWRAYYCYFGLNQTGTVIGAEGAPSAVKGGWAISVPDGTSPNGMAGDRVNLYPDSFGIIGASYGALFGPNRQLYFLDGVSTGGQFSQQVRSDFGFTSDQGNAEIIVTMPDQDWKIEIRP
jgi:hypothetical protein